MGRGVDRSPDRERPAARVATAPARPVPVRRRDAPTPAFRLPRGQRREPIRVAGRRSRLRGSESRLLEVVGTFRAVWTRDLGIGTHGGDTRRLDQDLRSLKAQDLIRTRRVAADRHGHSVVAVTLTDAGKALLEHHREPSPRASGHPAQAVYSGWVRPAELVHDATLYRMYLEEAARLTRDGSVVHRVILDHELKREFAQAFNTSPAATPADREARLTAVAAAQGLPIVDGHAQFPDLRLEIETAAGDRTRVDLELATEAYHAGHLRAKARAGFTVYHAHAGAGGAARLVRGGGSSGRGGSGHTRDYLSSLLSL